MTCTTITALSPGGGYVASCCLPLQASLPSAAYTVLRTASNLQPFAWNIAPEEEEAPGPSRRAATSTIAAAADGPRSAAGVEGAVAVAEPATTAAATAASGATQPSGEVVARPGVSAAAADTCACSQQEAKQGMPGGQQQPAAAQLLCALCRAPMTDREVAEALAAGLQAGRLHDDGAGHERPESAPSAPPPGPVGDTPATPPLAAGGLARFCTSCREQVLFPPGQGYHARKTAAAAGGSVVSPVLALLPAWASAGMPPAGAGAGSRGEGCAGAGA